MIDRERPQIAIIGKYNADLAEQILRDGFGVVFFKDPHHSKQTPRGIIVRPVDFSLKASILKSLAASDDLHIVGTVAVYESYVPAQHWIAGYYGIPHASDQAVAAATDKRFMRACFRKHAPHITPAFRSVRNEEDLRTFAKRYGFPLMLKPTNLIKSLLVTKNASLPELLKNYRKTIRNIGKIYEKEGILKTPGIIVEECLVGSFHSVDTFVGDDGSVKTLDPVDLVMGTELGLDDNFNYLRTLPSRLGAADVSAAKRLAEDAIYAIGLRNSPAHIEFVRTKTGMKVIEIGARVGGYRPRLYAASFGINVLRAQVAVGQGKPVTLNKTGLKKRSALFEIFPERRGRLHSIRSINRLSSRKSVTYVSVKRRFGDIVGPSKDGHRATAVVFLVNENEATFQDDLAFVKKNVRVRLLRKR